MPKQSASQLAEPETQPEEHASEASQNGEWQMPKPTRGQAVIFYYKSIVSAKNADVGFVSAVGERSIDVNYRGSGGARECYHVDDPRIVSNPDLKNEIGGLWDFTKEQRLLECRLEELESRLDEIEAKLNR